MSKTRDIRTRDEIVINVGKADDGTAIAKRRNGTPQTSKPNDGILKRRRKRAAINFYDLGQRSNGSGGWIDTAVQILTTPIEVGDQLFPEPLNAGDYDGRDVSILAVDPATWKTQFRKVTKGTVSGKYRILAACPGFSGELDSLSQWTAGGLIVEQSDLDAGLFVGDFARDLLFDGFTILDGQSNIKITATTDFADPDVPFTPGPVMDVFFLPKFVFLRGRARTVTFGERGDFGELYLTFPRDFIINGTLEYVGGDNSPEPAPGSGLDAATVAAIANWKSEVAGRQYFYDGATWSAGAFPPPGTNGQGIGPIGYDVNSGADLINGALIAVVAKAGTFYYFWTANY